MTLTDKEINLIEYLRQNGLPFGEMIIRFVFQDSVVVRIVVEEKKESIKL